MPPERSYSKLHTFHLEEPEGGRAISIATFDGSVRKKHSITVSDRNEDDRSGQRK
jgi:hypothetical protein